MAGVQRGPRDGFRSPILGPIGGIGNFAGYSLRSPVRGQIVLIVAATRGFGGRGWPECVQLGEDYASVVSAVDSESLSFADIASREVEVAGEFSFVAARRRGLGAPR